MPCGKHACLDNFSTHIMGDRSWRDRISELNQSLIREWLEEQDIHVVIATEGSLEGSQADLPVVDRQKREIQQLQVGMRGHWGYSGVDERKRDKR
jgi:hypothetical protein